MDQADWHRAQWRAAAPPGDLRQRLAQAAETGTPGERALAHYLLANLSIAAL
jgi:DNA-binding MurR/RpiR family transcriptional regulator